MLKYRTCKSKINEKNHKKIFKKYFKKVLTLNIDCAKIKLVPNNKKKERKSTLKSKQYPLRDQAGSLSTTKKQ